MSNSTPMYVSDLNDGEGGITSYALDPSPVKLL